MKPHTKTDRIIGHVDADAFFAAVEERDNPQFSGLPIVVGAEPVDGKGRGVVSTANYKAREYGIHSALPISQAWRLSEKARVQGKPAAVFLPGNFRRYSEVSHNIMEVIRTFTDQVEQVSVDEAFVDLSFAQTFVKAEKIAKKIKAEIKRKEKLTVSVGIAPNKLIAKIASDMHKPDGLTVVRPKEVKRFLEPLALRKIPGVGPKTEAMLAKCGMKTVADARRLSEAELYDMMGEYGIDLYEKLRGLDASPIVIEPEPAKSVGEQETFATDTADSGFILDRLGAIAENILQDATRQGFKSFRRIVLTMRFEDFRTVTRGRTLKEPTNDLAVLKREALHLLLPFFDRRENPKKKKYRLVGIRIEDLN